MMKIYNMGVLETFLKKGKTAQVAVDKILKKKPPLESEVLRDVCEYLTDNGYFFWRSNNIPVFGKNNGGNMTFRSLPKYTPRGLPDVMVVHNAEFIGIEVKRVGAKLRPEQETFRDNLNAHGGIYIVVHSKKELDFIFKNKIL